MAIIHCTECGNSVSSQAEACPHCGVAVARLGETMEAGTPVITTQETAKKFKLQIIFALLLAFSGCAGVFGLTSQGVPADDDGVQIMSTVFFVGILWYIVTKFRIWCIIGDSSQTNCNK